jgi:hypothetical protein
MEKPKCSNWCYQNGSMTPTEVLSVGYSYAIAALMSGVWTPSANYSSR